MTDPKAPVGEETRKEFEEWAKAKGYELRRMYQNPKSYADIETRRAFDGWQAASSQLSALTRERDTLKVIADKCGKEQCFGQIIDGCKNWVTKEWADKQFGRAESAEREAREYRKFLLQFGRHTDECSRNSSVGNCICGFSEAERLLSQGEQKG